MAKKYLLYIHDDRFAMEKNKSGLVNELLDRHYAEQPGAVEKAIERGDILFKPGKIIKEPEDILPTIKLEPLVKLTERFSGPTCKIHGLPLDERGRCLQKGCKYA